MNKVEFAKSTNSYITDYIKFADVKAGVLLTVSGLLAGGLGKLSLSIFELLKNRDNYWYLAIAIIIMLWVGVSLLCTLWMSLKALKPDTRRDEASLHSFLHIAECYKENYTQSFMELSCDEIVSHFCSHNLTLSHIANAKYNDLRYAVSWLRSSIIAVFILGGFYVFLSFLNDVQGQAQCYHDVKRSSIITSKKVVP